MTSDQRFAVLSALIDREPVDPDVLAEALEQPAGRAELVDFVRLRARVAAEFAPDDVAATPLDPKPSPVRTWLLRAALVILPLSLGAAAGAWLVEQRGSRPPSPSLVVKFVSGVDWK